MNCYNHPEIPAVGICTACNKGICPACEDQESNQLICISCSEIQPVISTPIRTYRRSYVRPIFLILFGLIYVIAFGLSKAKTDYVALSLGLLFIVYGGYLFYLAARFNNQEQDDNDLLDG